MGATAGAMDSWVPELRKYLFLGVWLLSASATAIPPKCAPLLAAELLAQLDQSAEGAYWTTMDLDLLTGSGSYPVPPVLKGRLSALVISFIAFGGLVEISFPLWAPGGYFRRYDAYPLADERRFAIFRNRLWQRVQARPVFWPTLAYRDRFFSLRRPHELLGEIGPASDGAVTSVWVQTQSRAEKEPGPSF